MASAVADVSDEEESLIFYFLPCKYVVQVFCLNVTTPMLAISAIFLDCR